MPYRLLEEDQPSFGEKALDIGKEAGRHGARTASNIATRAVGLPGDIFSLINEFAAKPASKLITGEEGVPYEETYLGKALPTTETHRKGLQEKTGEFLKPKNKVENFVDDVVEDTALLFNPSTLVAKGVKAGGALKSLFKSIGANLAGETAKQVAGSETAGDVTKLGSLFLLSVLDQESAAKQVGKLYGKAESNLPKNAKSNALGLEKNLDSLEYKVTRGRPLDNLSAPEKFVTDQTKKVRNLIKNGEISVEQAIAQKRSLNKELSTLYKEVPKKSEQKTVRNFAKQIGSFLNKTIEQYGKTNPKFYKDYKNADEAFGTLAKSNFLSHWIENNVAQSPLTHGLLHIVGGNIGGIASGTVGSLLPYQAAKLSYRIAKSPTLAKIYGNTLKAAAKEDVKVFNKYLKDLDEKLQEEENEDRYRFID